MWFKNLLVYRLQNWPLSSSDALDEKLAKHALTACGAGDMQTLGWAAPKQGDASLVYSVGNKHLICLGREKKLLPSSVVKQFSMARAQEIEEQEGYKPGRKQMKEIKEDVTNTLLPRAFAIRSQTLAWIDVSANLLCVDAASIGKAEDLIGLLFKCVEGLSLSPLRVLTSPHACMTNWVLDPETLPSLLTVDADCEFKGKEEQGAAIRYVNHVPETVDIQKHVEQGKRISRLAMTWADKVSFVLHENLQIKRISALDVLKESNDLTKEEDGFESDFVLMTEELKKLLGDLIEVLGGEDTRATQSV
jgi:recombination associated protein RdgC